MLSIKSLGLAIITASVVLGNQVLASVPTTVLDQHTNSYFWTVRPEMLERSIQSHQTQYKKEWLVIRGVLMDRLVWMELPQCYAEPGTYGYEVENYGETVIALTDAVFYARHPELNGRKIKPTETSLVREWNSIKESFPYSPC